MPYLCAYLSDEVITERCTGHPNSERHVGTYKGSRALLRLSSRGHAPRFRSNYGPSLRSPTKTISHGEAYPAFNSCMTTNTRHPLCYCSAYGGGTRIVSFSFFSIRTTADDQKLFAVWGMSLQAFLVVVLAYVISWRNSARSLADGARCFVRHYTCFASEVGRASFDFSNQLAYLKNNWNSTVSSFFERR